MNNINPVMACITAQASCEKIIEEAKKMSKRLATKVEVVTVQPRRMEAHKRARDMLQLEKLAKTTNTPITIIYSEHPVDSLASYAAKQDPIHIFTGQQSENSSFVGKLSVMCDCPVSMVTADSFFTIPSVRNLSSIKTG
ncbi:MAG: hypothetical protein RR177_00060 [Oscillospiraceae bacterium]